MSTSLHSSKLLPNHVAFIMDGNRRWAKKNKLKIIDGHKRGSEIVKNIVKKSLKLKIKYLTFFSFSTENWNRSKLEILNLQTLLKFYLDSEEENFIKKKIRFSFIGEIDKFDEKIKMKLKNLEKITKSFNTLFFTLALSYGSRSEIVNAIKKINKEKNDIKEHDISKNLMTNLIPDPDLVIRTSGEKRISNFLLWQIAYAELYFTKTLWPEFNSQKYLLALKNYINRKRRFGGD
ncbi:MAG: polyprenyl diphosphate synthase [Pseudomonadota bacterium]|nr:polyprenyl diphosphate synthase [Pseudomonadota bacterium]